MRHVTHAVRAGAVKPFGTSTQQLRAEASVAGVEYEPDVSRVHRDPALCGAQPAALFPGNSVRVYIFKMHICRLCVFPETSVPLWRKLKSGVTCPLLLGLTEIIYTFLMFCFKVTNDAKHIRRCEVFECGMWILV